MVRFQVLIYWMSVYCTYNMAHVKFNHDVYDIILPKHLPSLFLMFIITHTIMPVPKSISTTEMIGRVTAAATAAVLTRLRPI